MAHWIALLHGVNVGGHNRLPMADLRACLAGLGYGDVKTYIQSGNCVFHADQNNPQAIAAAITGAIETQFGFAPKCCVLSPDVMEAAIADNPFAGAVTEPKNMHLFFFAEAPDTEPDLAPCRAVAKAGEEIAIGQQVLYLHTPNGIGRSKLAAKLPRLLPLEMTARNLRSTRAILDLAKG